MSFYLWYLFLKNNDEKQTTRKQLVMIVTMNKYINNKAIVKKSMK